MAKWGEVLEVREIRQLNDKGDLVNVYRYQVKTKKGIVFTQLVTEADATPEKVDVILGEKAARLDKTASL